MSCPHKQQLLQPLKVVNDVVLLILEFIQIENPIISQILDHLQLLEVLLIERFSKTIRMILHCVLYVQEPSDESDDTAEA